MATIVNTPGGNESNTAIWVIGFIVLALIVLGAIFLVPRLADTNENPQPAAAGATDNNTVVPPVVNNYNTTINASTTVTGATTTNP